MEDSLLSASRRCLAFLLATSVSPARKLERLHQTSIRCLPTGCKGSGRLYRPGRPPSATGTHEKLFLAPGPRHSKRRARTAGWQAMGLGCPAARPVSRRLRRGAATRWSFSQVVLPGLVVSCGRGGQSRQKRSVAYDQKIVTGLPPRVSMSRRLAGSSTGSAKWPELCGRLAPTARFIGSGIVSVQRLFPV
jgi:hypothetical protein